MKMLNHKLLDHLSIKLAVHQSSLQCDPEMKAKALMELLCVGDEEYGLIEWNRTISYLLGCEYYFTSVQRAKSLVREELEKKMIIQKVKVPERPRRALQWLIPVLCGLLVIILMKTVFVFGFVPSASMEPTIHEGAFVLGVRIMGELKPGDIIIFERDGTLLVKRIYACTGDEVFIGDACGNVSKTPLPNYTRSLTVPTDCYFVMGDNSENSRDSRFWETPYVSLESVVGVVILY